MMMFWYGGRWAFWAVAIMWVEMIALTEGGQPRLLDDAATVREVVLI